MDADFSEVTFNNKLTFYESEFHKALFNRTKFSEVILKRSIFIDYAVFFGSRFSMDADFSEVTFGKGLDFSRSRFSCEADFSRNRFSDKTFFSRSTFLKEAIFYSCNFSSEAGFSEVTFSSEAGFSEVTFDNRAYFSGKFNSVVHFNHSSFDKPNKIVFDVEDLSKVSFMNTDISKIKFRDDAKWGTYDKFRIIEERWLEDGRPNLDLASIISIYKKDRDCTSS